MDACPIMPVLAVNTNRCITSYEMWLVRAKCATYNAIASARTASHNVVVHNATAATVEVNVQETVQHHTADVSSNTWEEEPAALPTSSWVDSTIGEAVETD
eukprot:jgi/Chlat1/1161/Chrsp112S01635